MDHVPCFSLSFLETPPALHANTVRQDSKRPSGADNAWIVNGFLSEMGYPFKALKIYQLYDVILVGGLEHEWIIFSHSVGNFIIPTDELHHYSEGFKPSPAQ